MTDKKSEDQKFENYLEGKSNLSKLYAESETGEPAKKIDDAIINAARQQLDRHSSSSSRGYRWYVPVALAASLLVVIFSIRLIPLDHTSEPDLVSDKVQNNNSQHSAASRSTPELILEKISRLIAEDKVAEAQEEYKIFVDLFPDYEIDYKKYPKLRKITEE